MPVVGIPGGMPAAAIPAFIPAKAAGSTFGPGIPACFLASLALRGVEYILCWSALTGFVVALNGVVGGAKPIW